MTDRRGDKSGWDKGGICIIQSTNEQRVGKIELGTLRSVGFINLLP